MTVVPDMMMMMDVDRSVILGDLSASSEMTESSKIISYKKSFKGSPAAKKMEEQILLTVLYI